MLAAQADQVGAILSNGSALARANWSMPPDHGGAVVRLILRTRLTASWLNELDVMRARMSEVRAKLGGAGTQGSWTSPPSARRTACSRSFR
jgi:aromatic-amino-acid transaminase